MKENIFAKFSTRDAESKVWLQRMKHQFGLTPVVKFMRKQAAKRRQ